MSLFAKVRKSLIVSMAVLSLAVFASAGTAGASAASTKAGVSISPASVVELSVNGQVITTIYGQGLDPLTPYAIDATSVAAGCWLGHGTYVLTGTGFPNPFGFGKAYTDFNGRFSAALLTNFCVAGNYPITVTELGFVHHTYVAWLKIRMP